MAIFPPAEWKPGEQDAFEGVLTRLNLTDRYGMFRRPSGPGNVNPLPRVFVYNRDTGQSRGYTDTNNTITDSLHWIQQSSTDLKKSPW